MFKILAVLGLAGIASGMLLAPKVVEAYRGDPSTQGPNYSEERHEVMEKAFENKDYNTWKDLMNGKGRVTQVINEQNFDKFAEMHKLRLENKIDEANKIKTELGLGTGQQNGSGYRGGK